MVPTERTRLRRKADRGHHDWPALAAVLDDGLIGHVGAVLATGPVVLPMAYGRIDRNLYLHGAAGNAILRGLAAGADACVTVTIVDGLVLARSAFHHSMNYRSAVCFGRAEAVSDPDEKVRALTAIVEHMVPGRAADTRPPSPGELRATLVVRFPLDEASVKVRAGGPIEDPDDLALGFWAGVIPLRIVAGEAVADDGDGRAIPLPTYVSQWGDTDR